MNPRRLRVAVLNRNFVSTGGGAERYSIALVEALAEQHDIHVFAQSIDHAWPGVTYHRVPALFRRPRWINQLWYATVTWWATRRGFDVVHSHENTWHGNVQTVHVLPINYSLFAGRKGWHLALRWLKAITSLRLLAYLWLEARRFAPRPGRQIVVTSETLRRIVARSHPEAKHMLATLTPGIAQVHGDGAGASKQAARRHLGLPAEGPVILFVANDFRKKGLGVLLKALATLAPEVTLAVVGNPVHAKSFAESVNAPGLKGRVVFLGQLKQVDLAYQAADCLAHPTLEDTFAMVVLEAMSWGLPVVVSGGKYCGISDLLSDGHNALLLAD
ncbi:MAG: hypothetical protein RLZZ401_689, partial [Pseudomonadota bacterium]